MSILSVGQAVPDSMGRQGIASAVLSIIAGATSVLAFAPFEWRIVAVLSLGALFWCCLESTPRLAFRNGFLFGLAQFGIGVSWIFISIHDFGQAPAVLASIITVIFVLVLALFPAMFGYLVTRLWVERHSLRLVIVFPVIWTLLEWIRSWLFTGFPWLLFGQAHVDTGVAKIIPLLGVFGASWLNAILAGLLVILFVSSNRLRMISIAVFMAIWIGTMGLGRIDWTQPSGAPVTVSMVQGNIPQDEKWQSEKRIDAMQKYVDLTQENWSSDLIIWPETAIPAYYSDVEEWFLAPLHETAGQKDTDMLIGLFKLDADGRRTYNSLAGFSDSVEFYNKRHLVPFGEFLPFRGLLKIIERWLIIPMSDLSVGENRPLMTLAGHSAGLSICYEDAYGSEMADALPEAEFLINVSNDAWFGDSLAPHQHLEIARLRALETGRYLLRSTNTGISAVISPQGEITAQSPQFKTDVLTASIVPHTGLTPFGWWKNYAVVTLLLLALSMITIFHKRAS